MAMKGKSAATIPIKKEPVMHIRTMLAAIVNFSFLFAFTPMILFAQETIVSCPVEGGGGDFYDRGFYVQNYRGTTIDTVQLTFNTTVDGTYAVSLQARLGSFDGSIIGTQTETVSLSSTDTTVTYNFGGVAVPYGSTIAFIMNVESGPSTNVYYDVGLCDVFDVSCTLCPGVIETEDTYPPLSTFRRGSVGVEIQGTRPRAIPAFTQWGLIIFTVLTGFGAFYFMRRRIKRSK